MANGWKGVNQTIAEIRAFGEDATKRIAFETQRIANQIAKDAKIKAPKNFGDLAQSISYEKVTETQYKVTINAKYGAYVEFGTGKKFNSPAEFEELAAQFKGKTGESFEKGVEAIKLWLHHKGGDEKDAEWILINLIKNGMRAQPYLYPAWFKGKNDYQENLNKLLKQLKKKI